VRCARGWSPPGPPCCSEAVTDQEEQSRPPAQVCAPTDRLLAGWSASGLAWRTEGKAADSRAAVVAGLPFPADADRVIDGLALVESRRPTLLMTRLAQDADVLDAQAKLGSLKDREHMVGLKIAGRTASQTPWLSPAGLLGQLAVLGVVTALGRRWPWTGWWPAGGAT
jgi:hypothetical protein